MEKIIKTLNNKKKQSEHQWYYRKYIYSINGKREGKLAKTYLSFYVFYQFYFLLEWIFIIKERKVK